MIESIKAHGLDGRLVKPDWPPLTLAELRALFGSFPHLGKPVDVGFASPRPLSAAGVLRTSLGKFFVKRHSRAVRDREGLLEEHRFMAYLHSHGAAVPCVLSNAEGESAIEIGDWTYEVHDVAAGIDLYGDAISWTPFNCAAHARKAGIALAQLHLAAKGFDASKRKAQPLVASFTIFAAEDPAAAMNDYLKARPALADHACVRSCADDALEHLAPYHSKILPLLAHLNPQWTHNDLHASNLFWSGAGPDASATAVVDFGLADRTNAVHDLANAIERNIVEWLVLVQNPDRPQDVPIHFDHLLSLLEGYESVRPLSPEEAAALAPMTALCHAEFALSEADYFLGVLHAEESARMAYDGWLVGHARWFHSERGLSLLDALRRWADSRHRSAGEALLT